MIVTCPSCSAKYRVRDEAVPTGGAELQCPSCSALFVAHPPKHSDQELTVALERLTTARDVAETRAGELERKLSDVEKRFAEAERKGRDADKRVAEAERRAQAAEGLLRDAERRTAESDQKLLDLERRTTDRDKRSLDADKKVTEAEKKLLEAERKVTEAEKKLLDVERAGTEREKRALDAERRSNDAVKRLTAAESRVQRLEEELARANDELSSTRTRDDDLARLREELARAQSRGGGGGGDAGELARTREELSNAQKTTGRLYTELELANASIARLQTEVRALQDRNPSSPFGGNTAAQSKAMEQLQGEVARLRDQLATAVGVAGSQHATHAANLQALIAAVGPMLWGLEQCIKYLEPFIGEEPALASHVRQLQLLSGVLTRLHRESAAA